ncbi:hypothetical protein M3Y99_00255600 [Aphelenchoides fujianensis]|nr:hypothetical protein M3Y99_00255600 [Aphelenchoides fujianensis]
MASFMSEKDQEDIDFTRTLIGWMQSADDSNAAAPKGALNERQRKAKMAERLKRLGAGQQSAATTLELTNLFYEHATVLEPNGAWAKKETTRPDSSTASADQSAGTSKDAEQEAGSSRADTHEPSPTDTSGSSAKGSEQ